MTGDQELTQQACGGDRKAFDEIVRRYQDGLYRYLLRLTGDADQAEEACQEAFVKLYMGLRRVRVGQSVAPLLFTIARHAWIDRQRRQRREEPMLEEPADGQEVAAQALAGLEREQVARAVAALPLEQREVVTLYYDQGLTQREIAQVMGTPAGTVASRLHRAVEALRTALAPLGVPAVVAGGPWGDDAWGGALHEMLAGQATAPVSLPPAVTAGVAGPTPAGAGLLFTVHSVWMGVPIMLKAGMAGVLALGLAGGAVYYTHAGAAPPLPAGRGQLTVMVTQGAPYGKVECWADASHLYQVTRGTAGELLQYAVVDLAARRVSVYLAEQRTRYTAPVGQEVLATVQARVSEASGQGRLEMPLPPEAKKTVRPAVVGGRRVEVSTATMPQQVRLEWRTDKASGRLLGWEYRRSAPGSGQAMVATCTAQQNVKAPAGLASVVLPAGTRTAPATLSCASAQVGGMLILRDQAGREVWGNNLSTVPTRGLSRRVVRDGGEVRARRRASREETTPLACI